MLKPVCWQTYTASDRMRQRKTEITFADEIVIYFSFTNSYRWRSCLFAWEKVIGHHSENRCDSFSLVSHCCNRVLCSLRIRVFWCARFYWQVKNNEHPDLASMVTFEGDGMIGQIFLLFQRENALRLEDFTGYEQSKLILPARFRTVRIKHGLDCHCTFATV